MEKYHSYKFILSNWYILIIAYNVYNFNIRGKKSSFVKLASFVSSHVTRVQRHAAKFGTEVIAFENKIIGGKIFRAELSFWGNAAVSSSVPDNCSRFDRKEFFRNIRSFSSSGRLSFDLYNQQQRALCLQADMVGDN